MIVCELPKPTQVYSVVAGGAPPPFALRQQYVNNMKAARDAAGVEADAEVSSGESEKPKKKPVIPKKKNTATKPKVSGGGEWKYNSIRMDFISTLRKESNCTFKEAKDQWDGSDRKRELLSKVSLQELKRRKFVSKEADKNPWCP